QKFLKLAKAFKQLESENVQIKAMNDCLSEELRGYESDGAFDGPKMHLLWWQVETPATDRIVAGIKAEAKSHDLNAFISHYSAELDNHIANGGDQFDERAVRLRGVIVGARMFREKLRDEEKALALREGDGK
ncbi:TPA: hypothetical protein ACWSQS_005433, partial [Klebsiella pneumoniae]